jgi:uncharacterized integral membrane protein
MKKFKITAAIIVLILILIAAWQNQEYFVQKNGLDLNFYFKEFSLPQTANGLYWIICFTLGFLLSYFSSLAFRFKAQRKIKMQNQTIENYRETVQELKKEVEKIKANGMVNTSTRPQEIYEEQPQNQQEEPVSKEPELVEPETEMSDDEDKNQ